MKVSQPSVQSLHLQLMDGNKPLFTATGFVCSTKAGPVLITNLHNVTGVDPVSGAPMGAGLPDNVVITHNTGDARDAWMQVREPLVQQWFVHPVHKHAADFVALPLINLKDVMLYPYSLEAPERALAIRPTETVSVVGFPFGLRGGGSMALWATGFIASEPDFDFDNMPTFLIDCRTRPGQSGSAVIAHREGGAMKLATGGVSVSSKTVTQLLGVYSGRVNEQSDLGIVWKTSAIAELLDSLPQGSH